MEELEKSVERKLVTGVKELGGLAYKWISPGNSGVPDRIVMWPDRIDLVELKTVSGKLSPGQRAQIRKIEMVLGQHKVYVLHGSDEVKAYLAVRQKVLGSVGKK